jgi:DNA-binding IclR family transcriptional regulator
LSVSELARLLSIPTSTCHGLVKTLEQCGYLSEIRRARGYYPTSLLLRQASEIARFDPIPSFLGPMLTAVREETGETVVLGKRVKNKAVYLEVLESSEGLRYIAKVGDARPFHATAIGKALLSEMTEEERTRIVSQIVYEPLSTRTITSPEKLLKSVEEGRKRGWFLCDGEYYIDICAIAVPIKVHGDQYCVIVSGPRERMYRNLEPHGQVLRRLKALVEGGMR